MHCASLLSLTACFEVLLEQQKLWLNMKYVKIKKRMSKDCNIRHSVLYENLLAYTARSSTLT